ncbi:hypothetical protein [Streptomyces sp. NPDC057702]|uniref:hypothetical protein n=1 Tax=unclassified Streptomyces TaxID=2593676 RepID=UPI00369C4A99
MTRGRPVARSRGGGASRTRRATTEQRMLTSVDTGEQREGEAAGAGATAADDSTPRTRETTQLWHITLSVSGPVVPLTEVRRGLETLANDHPFLLTSRYGTDHAEVRYWEEARDLHDAAALALRLWGEHRSTAKLPPWKIVGLEVISRGTYHLRMTRGKGPPPPTTRAGVHPY